MATPVFMDAATSETFDFSNWDVLNGMTSESTVVHNQLRSLRTDQNGFYVQQNSILADAGRRLSIYIRMASNPSGVAYLFFSTGWGIAVNSSGKIQLYNGAGTQLGSDGPTLTTNTWMRVALSYTVTDSTHNEWRVWLKAEGASGGAADISVTNGSLGPDINSALLRIGGGAAASFVYYSDIYLDDGTTLDDPGDIRETPKLPTTANANNFDTTVGTGAVNERALSETNGKQQAANSQVSQNYAIEAAASGDVDLSSVTLVARCAWIWAKAAATSGTPKITNNGTDTAITLTSTAARYRNYVTSATYPSNAATVGMVSTGTADDTFLYECGIVIAYTPAQAERRWLLGAHR